LTKPATRPKVKSTSFRWQVSTGISGRFHRNIQYLNIKNKIGVLSMSMGYETQVDSEGLLSPIQPYKNIVKSFENAEKLGMTPREAKRAGKAPKDKYIFQQYVPKYLRSDYLKDKWPDVSPDDALEYLNREVDAIVLEIKEKFE
jgi:hypothetical protein